MRQAALALYGVGEGDREFIMSQLPVEEQAELRALLAELVELGFAPDAARLDEAPSRGDGIAERLAAVSPVLDAEPASLVGTALAIKAWPWARAYLDGLPAPRRQAVEQSIAAYCPAAQRDARLARLLESAAMPPRTPAVAAPPSHWFSTMVRRWKR
jgi:hypothetical protein